MELTLGFIALCHPSGNTTLAPALSPFWHSEEEEKIAELQLLTPTSKYFIQTQLLLPGSLLKNIFLIVMMWMKVVFACLFSWRCSYSAHLHLPRFRQQSLQQWQAVIPRKTSCACGLGEPAGSDTCLGRGSCFTQLSMDVLPLPATFRTQVSCLQQPQKKNL